MGAKWIKFKAFLGFTHVVEQLLFSMCPLVTTFDFDLIFGLGLTFWLFTKLFFGSVYGSKSVLRSTHVAEQFLIFRFSSIPTFEFDLIFGLGLTFWLFNKLFFGSVYGSNTVLRSTHELSLKLMINVEFKNLVEYDIGY